MIKAPALLLLSFLILYSIPIRVYGYFSQNQTSGTIEKVYLQTDRDFYFLGDTIWFKANLLDGWDHTPVRNEQNLHVELIDGDGRITHNQILLFKEGKASAHIAIPDTISTGPTLIRAYTDYQKNFGEEWFFHRAIRISESKNSFELESEDPDKHFVDTTIDVSFFPEGGFLVTGVQNLVAFKAIDQTGKGISMKGKVLDRKGNAVVAFKTDYCGMGRLFFIPKVGEAYSVLIDDYPTFKYHFKDIREEGAKLSLLEYKQDHLTLTVITNKGFRSREPYYVACFSKDSLQFTRKITLRGAIKVKIETEALSGGINRFTLLNSDLEPLSERLVFRNPLDMVSLELVINQKEFTTRQAVQLDILNDHQLESNITALSVSVVNEHALFGDKDKQNMISYLFLDSELKGFIESPADYFNDDEYITSSEKLNLLMMTHGWSNYLRNLCEVNTDEAYYSRKAGISINGTADRKSGNKSLGNEAIILGVFSESEHIFLEAQTDTLGIFSIDSLYFKDSATVFAQVVNKKRNRGSRVLVSNTYEHKPPVSLAMIRALNHIPEIPLLLYRQQYYNNADYREYYMNKDAIHLEEVEITEERIKKEDGHMRIYQTASDVLEVKSTDEHYVDVFQFLQGKVAGVKVSGTSVSIRNRSTPLFVLDGMPIGSSKDLEDPEGYAFVDDAIEIVLSIPMSTIDKVEILKGADAAIFGARAANGVIAIYTKNDWDNDTEYSEPSEIITQKVLGFSGQREFYSPKYSAENINNPAPDHRTTLFWDPDVLLDQNNTTELSFHTADDLGYYKIIVEGVTDNGKICFGTAELIVDSNNKGTLD